MFDGWYGSCANSRAPAGRLVFFLGDSPSAWAPDPSTSFHLETVVDPMVKMVLDPMKLVLDPMNIVLTTPKFSTFSGIQAKPTSKPPTTSAATPTDLTPVESSGQPSKTTHSEAGRRAFSKVAKLGLATTPVDPSARRPGPTRPS